MKNSKIILLVTAIALASSAYAAGGRVSIGFRAPSSFRAPSTSSYRPAPTYAAPKAAPTSPQPQYRDSRERDSNPFWSSLGGALVGYAVGNAVGNASADPIASTPAPVVSSGEVVSVPNSDFSSAPIATPEPESSGMGNLLGILAAIVISVQAFFIYRSFKSGRL